jgi:hypothetical protein
MILDPLITIYLIVVVLGRDSIVNCAFTYVNIIGICVAGTQLLLDHADRASHHCLILSETLEISSMNGFVASNYASYISHVLVWQQRSLG